MDDQLTIVQILTSNETCRVCLSQSPNLKYLINDRVEDIILSDAYFTITGHIIEETSLITKSICDACVKLLIYSFNFKQQCDNTEKIILENSYLLADKVSPEDDNSVVTNDPLVIESKAIENSIPDLRKKEVENVFNCKDCGRNYRSLNSLRRHLKDHHYVSQGDENEYSYHCMYCDKKYNIQNSYYKHYKNMHPKEYKESIETSKDVSETSTPFSTMTMIYCDLCSKKFKNSVSYLRHVNHEHPESAQALKEMMKAEVVEDKKPLKLCPNCGKMANSRHVIRCGVEQKHNYTCKICNLKIKQSSNYFSHMRIHNEDARYKCTHCGMKFIHWSSWREHEDVQHLKVKRYSCKICSALFYRRLALIMHNRRDHTGERPYECGICQKKFISGNGLKNHMACHSNVKEFQCSICKKEFSRKKTLQAHQKIHGDVKNYSCSICNQKFLRNHVLKSHMKTQHAEVLIINDK